MASAKPCLWVKNYTPATREQAVLIDFERAGFLAAEHLINNSRQDLGLIYFGEEVTISHDFGEGVKKAALEYGARVRARNIAAIPYGQTEQIPAVLSEFDQPDGIVCFTDEFAAAVCTVLLDRKIRIPEDVAVTGCNNTSAGEWCVRILSRRLIFLLLNWVESPLML